MRLVEVKREDLKTCSLPERRPDHPLLSIGSICPPPLHLGTVCFSHPISKALQEPPEGRQTTPAGENVGGGHRQPNCPDLSALGVAPCPAPAGHGSPDGGSLTGLSTPPRRPAGPRLPGEHAVHNHGGDPPPRVEESKRPSKAWIQTPYSTEPRWTSDPGYVWHSAMTLWFFFLRVQEGDDECPSLPPLQTELTIQRLFFFSGYYKLWLACLWTVHFLFS